MPSPPNRNLLDPSCLPRSLLGVILEHKLDKLADETFICGTFAQVGWLNIGTVVDKHGGRRPGISYHVIRGTDVSSMHKLEGEGLAFLTM